MSLIIYHISKLCNRYAIIDDSMLPICLCLPNKAFRPATYTRHDAPAAQTRQHNGIDQHDEYLP
jgi:hypothetical protein